MPVPSREELIAYARQVAEKYHLDPETFLAVINGESGFNPAARGDYEGGVAQSGGVVQLYNKGLGPKFTQMTGMDPFDPASAFQAIDFMGREVAQGGEGYGPWHAAKRARIGQFQGVPGQTPATPGRRDRAGEVAQTAATPMKQPSLYNMFAEDKNTGPHTLGGLVAQKFGMNPTQNPNQTLLGGALEMAGIVPTGKDKQQSNLVDKAKKLDRGQLGPMEANLRDAPVPQPTYTLANALFGTEPDDPTKKKRGIFGLF